MLRLQAFPSYSTGGTTPGLLPMDHTEGNTPFEVIGIDFAGPLKYRVRSKKEVKAYLVLYACSLTRGLFLEVLPNLETNGFLRSLKRLIVCRGRPAKIYSDNGKTFVGAERWLKQVMRHEKLQDYLAHEHIKWQLNLGCAAWWGGQFERLIGLVKTALNKTIAKGLLT